MPPSQGYVTAARSECSTINSPKAANFFQVILQVGYSIYKRDRRRGTTKWDGWNYTPTG